MGDNRPDTRTFLAIFAASLLALLTAPAANAADVFAPYPYGAFQLSASAAEAVATARSAPSTASVTLVTVDASALGATATLSLPDGSTVDALRQPDPPGSTTGVGWTGAWDDGRATFVVKGGDITGAIRSGTESYFVTPLGGGVHMIVKVREVALPPVDDAIPIPGTSGSAFNAPTASSANASTLAGIDLLVVYTSSARAAYSGDITALIASQVLLANAMYASSDAGAVFNLLAAIEIPYDENSGDGSQADYVRVLDALKAGLVPALATVHSKRDELKADVVMLVMNKAHVSVCGAAYWGTVNGFLSADWAYGEVTIQDNCLTDGTTFAHELGHIFGAAHDPANSTSAPYQPYGYGYQYPFGPDPFRTIMAYPCAGPSCPNNYLFSNPNITYKGVPNGTATNDVARLIRGSALQVAVFRGPPISAVTPFPTAIDPLTLFGLGLIALAGLGVRRTRRTGAG